MLRQRGAARRQWYHRDGGEWQRDSARERPTAESPAGLCLDRDVTTCGWSETDGPVGVGEPVLPA